MSEVILGGIIAAGVAASTPAAPTAVAAGITATAPAMLAAGAALVAGYAVYKGLDWFSGHAEHDMERLAKALGKPPSQVTTVEARQEFERRFALARKQAKEFPTLRNHAGIVARIVALQTSPLAAFVQPAEWKQVARGSFRQGSSDHVVATAARRHAAHAAREFEGALENAARACGFTKSRKVAQRGPKRAFVFMDDLGRALVGELKETSEGPKATLDLTGFGDGSCHGVLDRILEELSAKGVQLVGATRRSHYRRQGVAEADLLAREATQPEKVREMRWKTALRTDLTRRRRLLSTQPMRQARPT